jgi:3-oxoacyl-[acyl-carrier protein] reductase
MDLGLRDRVAVVTAASKGLGRASAQALAAEGARVVLNARDAAALDAVAVGLTDVLVVPGDLTDPVVPGQLIEAAVENWGRVDIVVGNSGGPPTGSALGVDDDQLLAALNANMLSSVRLARAAVPYMRDRKWGRICFISSVTVRQPVRDLACPGLHDTDRLLERGTTGRSGAPEDFGKVVAFLCSEPANFVNGIAMGIDGGSVAGLL